MPLFTPSWISTLPTFLSLQIIAEEREYKFCIVELRGKTHGSSYEREGTQ